MIDDALRYAPCSRCWESRADDAEVVHEVNGVCRRCGDSLEPAPDDEWVTLCGDQDLAGRHWDEVILEAEVLIAPSVN